MRLLSIFITSFLFTTLAIGQVSVDVLPNPEIPVDFSEEIDLPQGDAFSFLSGEALVEIDPTARYSRSYGVYLRGAGRNSHKLYVDGHDMEDMTGIGRGARMDLTVISPLDKASIFLGPQGVDNGPGAESGVIKIDSNEETFFLLRFNNLLGNTLVLNQKSKNIKIRAASEYLNSPSVFPGGSEKDPVRGLDLRASVDSKFGKSSFLFLNKSQNYDDLNSDNIQNKSSFRKISFYHNYKMFSEDFKNQYLLKIGTIDNNSLTNSTLA